MEDKMEKTEKIKPSKNDIVVQKHVFANFLLRFFILLVIRYSLFAQSLVVLIAMHYNLQWNAIRGTTFTAMSRLLFIRNKK